MSNKLIDINALSEYKTDADLKYQDKLTPGEGIAINNGVVAVDLMYGSTLSGSKAVTRGAVYKLGDITLAPGKYYLQFTCQFASDSVGYRQCGFSTNTTDIAGFGEAYCDSRKAVNGALTQTAVHAIFEVSASEYPNGRTFYFLAKQTRNGTSTLTAYPRCYYIKFG